jgi:hypothetical protein
MTQHQLTHPLCPHLAAAALWTSKCTRVRRNGKPRVYYARSFGRAADDFLAL